MVNVLVIGGAGYIGSVVSNKLVGDHDVSVIDNLSKGVKSLLPGEVSFYEGDILDVEFLRKVFSKKNFDVVMHFAALKDAGESMRDLAKYSQNIIGTINILNVMVEFGVKKIVFSSSAAVYGEPGQKVISEDHLVNPVNFYGFTKLESERLIKWYHKQKGIDFVVLRYFNVAGDSLGYIDPFASNIFPIICEVLSGKRKSLEVFGDDYDTRDGTCIRDYIHVSDLADAHIKALSVKDSCVVNLGSSKGYSVLELIKVFEKVSGKKISFEVVGRRHGDPASLIASNKKAEKVLGWVPVHDLESMAGSTWDAYKKN